MARRCSTICLPFDQQRYGHQVADPGAFRQALDGFFREMPELFPDGFAQGYRLKDRRPSRKLGLPLRRLLLKATGETFTVRPSFALPYMAGWAADASAPSASPSGRWPWCSAGITATGTGWRSRWAATASPAPRCGGPACPRTCWPTSTTSPGTG